MKSLYIKDVPQNIGKEVELRGWVHTKRDHKKVVFIDLRDSTGIVQIVGGTNLSELSAEDVISVKGVVKERPANMVNKNIETGSIEFEVHEFHILAKSETLPFEINKEDLNLTLPVLLDYRSLTLRHPKVQAIFKIQEAVVSSFRDGLKARGFTEFQAPVIIPQTAEGGADVFEVQYFDYSAFLSQSPQFYKQIMVGVFEKVFTIAKTLRAEPSVTTRHLTESTTLDVEFGFIDSWTELMDMAEYIILFIFNVINKNHLNELKLYREDLLHIPKKIPRIKLREAQEIIYQRTGRDNREEPDLEPDDEREICRWAMEEKKSNLIFITHYPVDKRPFYVSEDLEDPGYTLSFDMLGYGVEWLTGGQRINSYKKLIENAQKRNINIEKSELYLQAFRYGMPPEGGFSFGSERIVMNILGLANIREASLFPRDMERIDVHLPSLYKKSE